MSVIESVLTFQLSWPAALVVVAIAFAVSVLLLEVRALWGQLSPGRRWTLVVLRAALVLGVVTMLYAPAHRPWHLEKSQLLVVLDDSASMAHKDRYAGASTVAPPAGSRALASRFDQARSLLTGEPLRVLEALGHRFDLRVFTLGEDLGSGARLRQRVADRLQHIRPDRQVSLLGQRLRELVESHSARALAGIVLLSDGRITGGLPIAAAARQARSQHVPLYIVGLGSDQPEPDLGLDNLVADSMVLFGQSVIFQADVVATGITGRHLRPLSFNREPEELAARPQSDRPQLGRPAPAASAGAPEELATRPAPAQSGEAFYSCHVQLYDAQKPETILAEQRVDLDPHTERHSIRLTYQPAQPGETTYTLRVQPLPEERRVDNNQQTTTVRVRDERVRVLLVQAYPNYEYRYLKSALSREGTLPRAAPLSKQGLGGGNDAAVRLTTILQQAQWHYERVDPMHRPVFPLDLTELLNWDVVILGDVDPELIPPSALDHLVAFVERHGRAVILMAGPEYFARLYGTTSLSRLLPAAPEMIDVPERPGPAVTSFQVQPTPLGWAFPSFQLDVSEQASRRRWSELAPLYWSVRLNRLSAGVQVLAERAVNGADIASDPIVCLKRLGRGNVLFHGTDETWRWRIRQGDTWFARYWLQTLFYLKRLELDAQLPVRLRSDRSVYDAGLPVVLEATVQREPAQADIVVQLERDGSPLRQISLKARPDSAGVHEALLTGLLPGRYRASVSAPEGLTEGLPCEFEVRSRDVELENVTADLAALRYAAEISGGKFYQPRLAQRMLADLASADRRRVRTGPPEPLWNRPAVAALVIALVAAEWMLRTRWGLR